jgi:hypothetical protein
VDELNVCPEPGAVVHLDGPQDSHYLKEITIAGSYKDFPAGKKSGQCEQKIRPLGKYKVFDTIYIY